MTSPTEIRLEILADPEALSRRVANWMLKLATTKIGLFSVCLSGGSTPRQLYEHLAEPPYRNTFPWSRTHWFWGDEQFVPHDDPLSNYRMVREALLSRAPISQANIHSIPTEGISPEAAAAAYERELKSFYSAAHLDPARPLFDVRSSRAGTGRTYRLTVPWYGGARGTQQLGCRRGWRQARGTYHLDLSGAREQPTRGLSSCRGREKGDLQEAS